MMKLINGDNKLIQFKEIQLDDFHQVQDIYLSGINTGNATFQTSGKTLRDWQQEMMHSVGYAAYHDDRMLGWATLSPVSDKCAYKGVSELSIYISPDFQGNGLGKKLLTFLLAKSEELGIWTVQSGVFPENVASIKLHLACGFRVVGVRERIGKLHGAWRDVLLLERRSQSVL
jgi:L-amino acid N-acyltransferase YncA